jgi:hypothetical protein
VLLAMYLGFLEALQSSALLRVLVGCTCMHRRSVMHGQLGGFGDIFMLDCTAMQHTLLRCCAPVPGTGYHHHSPTLVTRDFGAMRFRPCFSCAAPALPGFFFRAPCGIRNRCQAVKGCRRSQGLVKVLAVLAHSAQLQEHACSTAACWATEASAELLSAVHRKEAQWHLVGHSPPAFRGPVPLQPAPPGHARLHSMLA